MSEVLATAFARWTGAARLPPADLLEASAIFQEREFDDLDTAFYRLDAPAKPDTPPGPVRTSDALDAEIDRLAEIWIEVLPPEETDADIVAMSAAGPAGDAEDFALWRRLAAHE